MKKIIFTLAAVGMLSACSLDETPYGFYSSDNFYKTEEDAESGLMYAYNALNYLEYLRGIWYLGDIPTEAMYPKSDEPGDIHMLQQWTVNSETELTMYYFKYCYIGINRANTVIERVSGGNLNETVKNRVVGEALFLRAWNYFNLVRAYGRVPLYTEPISSLEETTPQMAESIDKIYDRILEDLLAAEKMLTVNKVFGRIDKVGAQALLSKVYLTLASSIACKAPGYASAPRNADEMYTQAAYWSRKVVFDYKETYTTSTATCAASTTLRNPTDRNTSSSWASTAAARTKACIRKSRSSSCPTTAPRRFTSATATAASRRATATAGASS